MTRSVPARLTLLVLIDVGPNLGAINRSALIASDQVCLPLAPDLFSLQGLKNLGPTLREWRAVWAELLTKAPHDLQMPKGSMQPIGYIVMQHGILDSRPVKAYSRWMDRIPGVYRDAVLDEPTNTVPAIAQDPYCLSLLKPDADGNGSAETDFFPQIGRRSDRCPH